MSGMTVNLALGGSMYRASQNAGKVNKAINMMLNRLETGNKYQYAYQNVSAVTEGADLKAKVATAESAVERNNRYQQELDPVMQAQTEIMSILGEMKEIANKYGACTDSTGSAAQALSAQFDEKKSAADALAASVSFNGKTLAQGLSGDIKIDGSNSAYTLSTGSFSTSSLSISSTSAIDTAITGLAKDSAKLGTVYNDVLGGSNNIMTSDINAMGLRYSSLLVADDNETSAMISSLNSRMDAINAARQYGAAYAGNAINLTNLLA